VSKPRRKQKKPARPRRTFKGWLIRLGLKLAVLGLLVWAVIALGYYAWALTFDLRRIADIPQRSVVYDKDGKPYSRLAGENRVVVPFDHVSNSFVNALLAREDTRFYYHHGIDPIGILRAVGRNFIAGGFRQGASTITQQLARNSFPLGGKNFHRKLIEAALAYRIETELTKEEILEAYMNRIYFGSGVYGIETASRLYFNKPASRLNLPEAATIAGLIRSPNRFSPLNNPAAATRERDTVLRRMLSLDFITDAQCASALRSPLEASPRSALAVQENWATDAVQRELDLVIEREKFDTGGLAIYTTLDGTLQTAAENAVAGRLDEIEARPGYPHRSRKSYPPTAPLPETGTPYLQGAAIAIDNRTGGIRAIAGGRDLARSRFNRALLAHRQIGSAVKPFVYATAFENGLGPGDSVGDNRIAPGEIPAAYSRYDPSNSDNTYRGDLPAAEGLVLSRNTMTIRIGIRTGLDRIAETIIRAGLHPNPPRYPAMCLGSFESGLRELTSAYTTFATGGVRLQPYLIDRITDSSGQTIYRATHGRLRVVTPEAANRTASILEEVVTRGTASRARSLGLRHKAAGKTGTTNEYQDAWFVGFDDKITCGVWVGFDTPVKIMPGGTGGELALPIWVDIMESGGG